MIVDNIDYTPATLKDFVNFPAALNAFGDLHLGDISETRRMSIPAGRATNDGMREYETNDNNVVKGSHVADYRTPTEQIPREIALAIARSLGETSATELINTM